MTTEPFSSENALTTLLTVESLLFATFGIAIGLSSASQAPQSLLPLSRQLATAGAIVLTLLAVTAGIEWWHTFIARDDVNSAIVAEAAGTAFGILAPPCFAWLIACTLKR